MKKLLLFFIPLLMFPLHIEGASAIVQTKVGNGGGYVNSYTITPTSAVTAGNTLILTLTGSKWDTTVTISDDQSNTWTKRQEYATSDIDRITVLWSADNVAGATTVITVQFGSGHYIDSSTVVREYSGLTTSSYDTGATGSDYGAYVQNHTSSSTPTTAQANELLVGGGGCSSTGDPTFTATGSFGNSTTSPPFDNYVWSMQQDRTVTATGAYASSWDSSNYVSCYATIGTFKETSARRVIILP
jgi:hypothetical protein